MAETKVVFHFPAALIDTPVSNHLVKEFGLEINILRANVEPDKDGVLVLGLRGTNDAIRQAFEYVRDLGIKTETLENDVSWHEDLCTHCTACVGACPTGALSIQRPEMRLSFDRAKCIACGLCVPACPFKAIEVTL